MPGARTILEKQPTSWSVRAVKTIGIFEAKTRFPALCESVATSRTPVLVSKRGRPCPSSDCGYAERPGFPVHRGVGLGGLVEVILRLG